jgi:plasmid stabilization system protein ParE
MKVITTREFREKVRKQFRFISKDKPQVARKLKRELDEKIKEISIRPYSYRISPFFNDTQFRDMIFYGYKVGFQIFPQSQTIVLFSFTQWDEPESMPEEE